MPAPALLLLALLAPAGLAAAGEAPAVPGYERAARLLAGPDRRRAAAEIVAARDASLVAPLVDALFFTPKLERGPLLGALAELAGERPGEGYYDWVELVGRRADLAPPPRYLEWKRALLRRIDPVYVEVLYDGAPTRIRLEEVVWGGVRFDGIPALERPPHVPAAEARYLDDGERVFGVSAGGVHRAYPLRILSWHEMVNDRLGGEPIVLSFCTLCDSGVVYSARTSGGGAHVFGTSGLLYRSNKLMFDRATRTLWTNIGGEAVLGELAAGGARLELLAVVRTTWGEWRRRHPDSTVLRLDPEVARRSGFDYRPGAADRARRGVSFPVWQKSRALPPRSEVLGLRRGEAAKAYPLDAVLRAEVVNDGFAGAGVVLAGDAGGAVRVYERGDLVFAPGPDLDTLVDASGRVWRVAEDALLPPDDSRPLARLPAHASFWFAWYGFFPRTEIYAAGSQE
jgi:hypothetical protein